MSQLLTKAAVVLLCLPALLVQGAPVSTPPNFFKSALRTQTRDIATSTLEQTSLGLSFAGTYPRITNMSDGSLVGIYTAASGATRTLQTIKSTDGGASFSTLGSVASGTGDVDNGFLLQVPGTTETLIAAFRNHDYAAGSTTDYAYFRITVCQSTDGGATWAFLSQVIGGAASATNYGYWEPFMRVGADGKTIQLYFSNLGSETDQQTYRATSTDGGKTWSKPADLLWHPTSQQLRDGMVGVAESNGALVAVFETNDNAGLFTVCYIISHDDGASWSGRGTLYRPSAAGHNAGAPQVAAVGTSGALAVSFMTDEGLTDLSWPNVAEVDVSVSDGYVNGGISWSADPSVLSSNPSHWAGLLSDGSSVVAVWEKSGTVEGDKLTWSDV